MKPFLFGAILLITMMGTVGAQTPGGGIVVTYKDDISTLDPAIGYDWQNFSIIKAMFSGLMDYEPGTATLTPNLATDYKVSDDGRTYTFTLREGVVFHNGRTMTAEDVKYSLERTLDPATRSPGQGFYLGIDGAQAFVDGEAETVSGIAVPDATTVEITLTEPSAPFLHLMALNFSFVVPREEVERYGEDFGRNPVGTGAFRLREWVLGQRLVIERNPEYFREGLPYLDEVVYEIGVEPTVALLRFQRGQADILGDGVPPAQFVPFTSLPANEALISSGPQLQTGYLTLNANVPPFDDVRVRRAVNMAVNKDRVIQLINGRATPAAQPLPPLMPGYADGFEGYAYDPEGARALLAEAGFEGGFTTELYATNTDPNPRIAQALQQDLAAVGVTAELRTQAQSTVIAAGGEPEGAPMIWSGGMAWIADYPDPSNFYWPILSCAAATPGGWNWAWYCNEELDTQAAAADAMVRPDQTAARAAAWADIYTTLMDDAPWVPVFNETRYTVHSARLAGPEGAFVDPTHTPVDYENVFLQ